MGVNDATPPRQGGPAKSRLRIRPDRAGLLTLALLLAAWEIAIRVPAARSTLAPSLLDVVACGWQLAASGKLALFYGASLARVLAGFATGALLGLALGAWLGLDRWADRILGPIFTTLRQIPIFGLVPLMGLWFGTGELSKFVMTATAAFYPLLMHTHEGLAGTPRAYRDVAAVLAFDRWTLLRKVMLPSAAPAMLTGFKHSLAYAWIAGIGAELFLPGNPGLGTLLSMGRAEVRMDYVLLGVAIVGVTGHLMSLGMAALGARLTPWLANPAAAAPASPLPHGAGRPAFRSPASAFRSRP